MSMNNGCSVAVAAEALVALGAMVTMMPLPEAEVGTVGSTGGLNTVVGTGGAKGSVGNACCANVGAGVVVASSVGSSSDKIVACTGSSGVAASTVS